MVGMLGFGSLRTFEKIKVMAKWFFQKRWLSMG